MDFLTRFGLEKSRVTVLVMIGLLLGGLMGYVGLSKREDPAITLRTAVVSAGFDGMSPERMEALIVKPIERKVREIGEVSDINVLITTGRATVYVDIEESISSDQLDVIFQNLRNKIEEVKYELPQGTSGPFVNTDYGDVAIATVAVTGNGFSYAELKQYARQLQEHLYTTDGVSKASLLGVQEERVWLEIDSRRLAAVGVQVAEVLNDLREQNVILPAGEIDADGTTIILEANGDLKSIKDIEDVLTKVDGLAGFVRLQDILSVRRGYVDPLTKPAYYNGEPAVIVSVEMSDGKDIQAVGLAVKKSVSNYENQMPIGIQFRFSTYQEEKVTVAIKGALSNVAQTVTVVLLVMLFFLGMRSALIISAIVPFTVCFALIGMGVMGTALEQVSIAAIIISLGLLVDNGLVVIEDVQNQVGEGVPPQEAALGAGRQYAFPLAVASITTVSAFLPMMLIEGTEGEYAFSLGSVVALMLAGSWFTALYILPRLAAWLVKPPKKQTNDNEPSFLVAAYGKIIGKILPFGLIIIVACYGMVMAASMVFGWLKAEMFPLSERNQFLIYMDMPKGTAISETNQQALAVDRWLRNKNINPEVSNVTLYVGDGGPRFYLALAPADANPASAFFLINTPDFEGTLTASERAQQYLIQNHPEARFKIKQLAMGGSESGIVEVKISGTDADLMLQKASEVEQAFSEAPGVYQNENDWGNKVIKVVVDIQQDKARELGVTSENISDALNTYFTGTAVSTYREGDESIPIEVRAEEAFRGTIEDLANLTLTASGRTISLDQVAIFRPRLEFSQIRRENQQRVIKVSAKSNDWSAAQLLASIQDNLDNLDLPAGYSIEIDGETEQSKEVNEKLGANMPAALAVMLLALMVQFNSARRVLLTFMTIPLIIIGGPLALYFTSQPMSFFAILGTISLAGIIINNAIVMIDQIDIERKTLALKEAVVQGAQKRVTPVLLTSLTTVFGLLPMAIAGGNLWEPMAALMIGGLAVSSILSLFFVPSAYYLMFRFGQKTTDETADA